MENKLGEWGFNNGDLKEKSLFSIRSVLETIMENLKEDDERVLIHLGRGDPSSIPCFRTSPVAEDAIFGAVRSAKFNGYAPAVGIYSARRSIADYLSHDLLHHVSPDDVFLTPGANQAIEVVMSVLARPGANILFPKPGYPFYDARAACSNLEVRHFDLLPEKGWEVDLKSVETLVDDHTIAIVIINPGNPCGNVFTSEHLQEIAETAKNLGILVIADEVYSHLCFGSKPFVPMGVFGSITPILTLGSISKRWIVPGWRLGWIAMVDPSGVLKKSGIKPEHPEHVNSFMRLNLLLLLLFRLLNAFKIILNTVLILQLSFREQYLTSSRKRPRNSFQTSTNVLKEAVDAFYTKVQEIPCFICPYKPEGAMSMMIKLNLSLLEGINDDMDFCSKLAHEESVIILPGVIVGLKNWLRLTFAMEPAILEEGLDRIKAFYLRHSKVKGL